jgi:large subunit ribosomal protein L10
MTKDEKRDLVLELTETFRDNPNFYIVDISGFSVEKTNAFRRMCFQRKLKVQMVKNKLIEKSLNQLGTHDFRRIKETLNYPSTVIFAGEDFTAPAKLIKEFRADEDKPALKAAFVEGGEFIGEQQLDALVRLKSKKELLGEIVTLLQSPIQNVLGALTGQGSKLASLVQAIADKKS